MTRPAPALLLAVTTTVLAGCAGEPEAPERVRVQVGNQDVTAAPSQYCVDGEGQRYGSPPPVIEVSPDAAITLTVPERTAERGWEVQVFDEKLEQPLGEVDVPAGEDTLAEINSSDVVPPAFHLVVVEDKGGDCGEFTAAWPIGFLRAGG